MDTTTGGALVLRKLLDTNPNDVTLLLSRVALGVVILPHGAQKLLGWFDGYGFAATMSYFDSIHVPALLAFLVIVAESFGALALIFGLLTRAAAFGIGAALAGAMVLVHLPNGFFMNWFGKQKGEGIEYFVLILALAGVLMLRGAGT